MRQKTQKLGRIRATLLTWLGVPIELTDAAFWSQWANPSTAAGQTISESTILSLSAAWACTRLISETISTLPLHLYERTPNGRKQATNHNIYNILHKSPDGVTTAAMYWESVVASVLLRGNAFSRKRMIGDNLVGLEFIPPGRINAKTDSPGNVEILFIESDGKQKPIPKRELFHVPGFSLDGKFGLSTIKYGAAIFGSALAATEAANKTFENGLAPTVAFTLDQVLKPDQRAEFRQNLTAISGALNAGKSPLLEGGMDVKTVGINPSDAQLLESRGYSVEEVCRWYRVDPSMVGHGNKDSNWGTGLEQKLIGFLTFTLRPWLTRIEQKINLELLSPADRDRYYAEFSIEGLLRADSAARAQFYSVMVNNGILTRDEVRELENMPLKGGNADVLTVQTAMAPLDSLGRTTTGDTARAALAAWLEDKENK